jgi:adenosylhomocysteine nucleosidase
MRPSIEPRALVLAPLSEELAILRDACGRRQALESIGDLRIPCAYLRPWRVLLAAGGHGKAQFAVQAQYLVDCFPSASLIVCAGAAGSLDPDLSVGDVVVGTETIEHDYRLLFLIAAGDDVESDPDSVEPRARRREGGRATANV